MIIREIYVLTKRSLKASIRNPFVYIPNFVVSLFFLFIYSAGLGGITKLPQFGGIDYLAFTLPVAIVSAAIGAAAAAGNSLVQDLECGYFSRLTLTPTSRLSIILGPIITGTIQVFLQTLLIILVAMLMGLSIDGGLRGISIILLLSMEWGLAFAGFATAIALSTKSSQAVQTGTMIFFPLLFLSTTFVPMELIEAKWLRIAAKINPTTYIMEGMRASIIDGWMPSAILYGLLVGLIGFIITIGISTMCAKKVFNE